MLRISEIKLPLDHDSAALPKSVAITLGIPPEAVSDIHVFKRSFDARKADLLQVYIIDVALADPTLEAQVLARFAENPRVGRTPDMTWRAPAQAPAELPLRPVVIGFGPCGI